MRTIPKLRRIRGTIDVPPSRDETLRSLLRAAVAPEAVTIANGLDMDDTRYVLETIRKLGFEVSGSFRDDLILGDRISIYAAEVEIDVGDAESAFRWLLPFLSFTPGRTILKISHPVEISPPVESLRAFGAEIDYPYGEGEPPLQIRGKVVRGGGDFASDDEITLAAMKVMAATFRDGLWIDSARVQLEPTPARIDVPPDRFLTGCWRALAEEVGGNVILNGERIEAAGGRPPQFVPRNQMESAAWQAISALAVGDTAIAGDAALARAFPRFWKIFDEVVAASS